jgi:hypothetical protein
MPVIEENRSFPSYEPPELIELGSVHALTQTGKWDGCFFDLKKFGKPDYMFHIAVPIANCST